jgi:hypothetical protein
MVVGRSSKAIDAVKRCGRLRSEVGVDEIHEEVRRVRVRGDREAHGLAERCERLCRTAVHRLALGQDEELVEEGEGGGLGLVDGRNNDNVLLLSQALYSGDDLESGGRIQTAGDLVQK